ncbi:hypothetical protein MTQ00_13945 [Chryseobacterium sp. B21-037]|uniref:hypothetical protein n=1 Tax=unclassified Chryseobacterium TaxID=2593645 RepID=UPI002358699B|nr:MULTISPECIES: hypothetical protein [unclassified Chryseobacterium]MDC8105640.1 hypothetical protein [Chryseobacterium sp. B21-037]MDQ1806335.1 hypothetical protein [Chryseobacterium sp. CKR4-1]
MNNDQFQDKYDEIFRDMKEEKMDWDFEDFLQKAEGIDNDDHKIIPLEKKKPSFPKWFWMAASVVLLVSAGLIFNYYQNVPVADQSKLVENQIKQQKQDFIEENHEPERQVAVNSADSIAAIKSDSVFQRNTVAEKDVLDEILPKRGRLKKEVRPKFTDNSSYRKLNVASKDSTGYNNNYVIVNGKRIDNVEEAINVTKYSFQIFANNVSEKLVQPKVMDDNY